MERGGVPTEGKKITEYCSAGEKHQKYISDVNDQKDNVDAVTFTSSAYIEVGIEGRPDRRRRWEAGGGWGMVMRMRGRE